MPLRKIILCAAACSIGLSATAAQAQGISLLRDAEIEQFLDDYSRPIFRAAGLNPNSIEILIVNDQSFNAFAGGRYMGVNTGLLITAETPNQVEAVIAHEAGHLAGGHSARNSDAIASATRPMLLGLLLAAGAIAAGEPGAGLGLIGLGQNVGIANYLTYSRGQEATADQSSITYLDALGKSSKGALELWSNIRNSQIIRGQRINPYMQTHPLANDRLTALQSRVEQSPFVDVKDPPQEIERLRLIQAKIRGFLNDPNATLRFYPLSDRSDAARYARAVAYYRQSQIDKSLGEIEYLTNEYPGNAYFHELKGQILFEYGRTNESVDPYRQSVELRPDNALLRLGLGRALLATGEHWAIEQSVAEFKRALVIERDNSFAWFELARAYGAQENEVMANLATAESRFYAGAHADANAFARRAMTGLKRGSPEWRQAADIILASQPDQGAAPLPDAGAEPGDPQTTEAPPTVITPAPPQRQEVPDPQPETNKNS